MKKLRIAWFSPLSVDFQESDCKNNYRQTLSAYVTDELVPLLSQEFDIELFHNSFTKYADLPTFHYLQAAIRHKQHPYDIFFYQLEDNIASNFVRTYIGLYPGIVWFHNFMLSTDGSETILNSTWQDVIRKFTDPSFTWPKYNNLFPKDSKLALREAAYAIVPLFSNESETIQYTNAAKMTLKHSKPQYLPIPVREFKSGKCNFSGIKIAFCGRTRLEDHAHKLLQALDLFQGNKKLIWLIDKDEEQKAINLLVENCGSRWRNFVSLEIGRNTQKWLEIIKDVNVAVHLLFCVYGNIAPYLQLSLANNIPTIVNDFAFSHTLPNSVVFKIKAGDTEANQILQVFNAISSKSHDNQFIKNFAQEMFDARMVAANLSLIFRNNIPLLSQISERWNNLQHEARLAVINDVKPSNERDAEIKGIANQSFAWQYAFHPVMQDLNWE